MSINYQYDKKIEITDKTLIGMCKKVSKGYFISVRISQIFVGVIALLFLLLGLYIEAGIIVAIEVFGILMGRYRLIKKTRENIAICEGKTVEFSEECFGGSEAKYEYSQIKEIIEEKEYVLIKIEKKILPVFITESNKKVVHEVVNLLRSKLMIKVQENAPQEGSQEISVAENKIHIKLSQHMSSSDYRHIWNEIAPKRSLLRWIICYILLALSTRGVLDINFGMGILGFLLIEIILTFYLLRTPSKVKKYLVSNLSDEIVINENALYIGDKYISCANINKVIVGKKYVYIKAYKLELIFTFVDEKDTQLFYSELRACCSGVTKYVSVEKRMIVKTVMLVCAVAFYAYIAIGSICTVASYDRKVAEYTERFKEVYNIELYVLDDSDETRKYEIDNVNSKYSVISTLENIDKMLERFPKDIFSELNLSIEGFEIKQEKLSLIISGDIDNKDKNGMDATGLTVPTKEGFSVYIDCDGFTIASTFAHEMCHVLVGAYEDYNIDNLLDIFLSGKGWSGDYEGWSELNPSGFVYYEDRGGSNINGWRTDNSYTKYEKSKDNIYFVSNYSKESVVEDMAETFKYLVTSDNSLPAAYDSPHIQAKAKLLIQWLDEKYDSVDEDVYWNKWFKE